MSMAAVKGALSSLKACQEDLGTGIDVVTDVAIDLVETQDEAMNTGIKEMEAIVLECAKLDREINHFVDIVQQVIQVSPQQPEAMFSLSARVKEQFSERVAQLSDAELKKHPKMDAFKDNIKNSRQQANQLSDGDKEELDDDITVTQSQVNFSCPLTQVEMVNPVKNRKCNHHYDEEAILGLIKKRHSQKKKCRCPVVGCGNADVIESDLILDQILRRKIQRQNKKTVL